MAPSIRRTPRPTVRTPDDVMTLTEHLSELRVRIIRSALAVVILAILIIAFYDQVLDFLRGPYQTLCDRKGAEFCGANYDAEGKVRLIFLDPLEGFGTRIRIASYGGIILAMPVIIYQAWRFVVPALHPHEKRYARWFGVSAFVLFALGAVIAYLTLEKALEFLIAWSGHDTSAAFRVSSYVSLVGLMVAAFGFGFEFPLFLVFLQLVGVVEPQTLIRHWRYAVVIITFLAAIITPSGDPISLAALAIPMTVLYGVSILIGLWVQRRRRRAEAAESSTGNGEDPASG